MQRSGHLWCVGWCADNGLQGAYMGFEGLPSLTCETQARAGPFADEVFEDLYES